MTGLVVAVGALVHGRERDLRPDQHRHAVGVRDRLRRRAACCAAPIPTRPRPFRVPVLPLVSIAGALACLYVMLGLPAERLGALRRSGWRIGLVLYFAYGIRHSKLRDTRSVSRWTASRSST